MQPDLSGFALKRLLDSAHIGPGCWPWKHALKDGYGRFNGTYAHRASLMLHGTPIPTGGHVHHICQNRACINPDHLTIVSPYRHRMMHKAKKAPKAKPEAPAKWQLRPASETYRQRRAASRDPQGAGL
jgi:hypothetical protein